MEQELRGADGKLYGMLRDGRWLEIQRGERSVQFDLAVFVMVEGPRAEGQLEYSDPPLHFATFFGTVERIRSTE
jgi:hypothetical protein